MKPDPVQALVGATIVECVVHLGSTVVVARTASGDAEIMIEADAELSKRSRDFWKLDVRDPAQIAPLLSVIGSEVGEASSAGGLLRLSFTSGHELTVPFNARFEAWQVVLPDKTLVVCAPGGDLSIFARTGPT